MFLPDSRYGAPLSVSLKSPLQQPSGLLKPADFSPLHENPHHLENPIMKVKLTTFLTTLLSLAALSGGGAHAAVAVNWGGDYVAANVNYARSQSTVSTDYYGGTGQYKQIAWSESTVLNPSSGYTAPSGMSSTFYGGMFTSASGTGLGFQTFTNNVQNNAAADRLGYRSQLNASTGLTGRNGAVGVVFLQSDFMNGLNTGSVTVDVNSSISMNITGLSSPFVGRYMMKNGVQWYVSNTTYNTTGSKALSGLGLVNETWATFDPSTNLDFNNTTFSAVNWTGITGVGYYADFALAGTSIAATDFSISSFSANLVPEPGAALLGGLGLLALLRRRRA
jgi:hypothetical protein